MQAFRAVIPEPKQIALEEFTVSGPGAGDVLVKSHVTLISPGTERAFFLALPNTNATYPLVPGYSMIGEVLAVGPDVERFRIGDRVACTAHHASHEIVPAASCQPVPDNIASDDAVYFNLAAIAMQGVRKARLELGESALVLGAGPIGMLAMKLAQLSGALPVIGVDVDANRLDVAQGYADETLIADDTLIENVQRLTGQDGATVVIELTGAPQAVVTAFQVTATKGRVVLVGGSRGLTAEVNFYRDVHRKGLTVIGGHEITRPRYENSPGWWTQQDEHRVVLDLMARGRLHVEALQSLRFPWQEFPAAYDVLTSGARDVLGMVIDWTA